jgi:hypothetical protein
MEPVSVTTALVAALTASLNDVTKTAVKDGYSALKNKVVSLCKDNAKVTEALDSLEGKPDDEAIKNDLNKALVQANVQENGDIQRLVNTLVEQLGNDPIGKTTLAKFNIQAEKVGAVADYVDTINQQF